MNPIFQIIISAYLFLAVPFLFGILEAGIFRKEKKSATTVFANGYLSMMALFCVVAIGMIRMKLALSMLAKIWLVVTLVISIFAILIGRQPLRAWLQGVRTFWTHRSKVILLMVLILSLVLSIGFTKPDNADATVEIVATSLTTDSMYRHDAYTGYLSEYADAGHVLSPIEMLYAVGASITGMQADVMVYYVLPISLLLFFFTGMWRLGSVLFEKEEQRILFELLAVIIYWMTTYLSKSSLVTGIFLNSWHGLTLLSCVVLPFTWACILDWMKQAQAGLRKVEAKLEKLYMTVVLLLAGQLTYDRGGFYVACMLALGVAVVLVKGGYDYGVASGRFKKRI